MKSGDYKLRDRVEYRKHDKTWHSATVIAIHQCLEDDDTEFAYIEVRLATGRAKSIWEDENVRPVPVPTETPALLDRRVCSSCDGHCPAGQCYNRPA